MKLMREEMETHISIGTTSKYAQVYTSEPGIMALFDSLVEQYPQYYRLTGQTEVSKTYSMPKSYVSYRKPRNLTEEQRERKREKMKEINSSRW